LEELREVARVRLEEGRRGLARRRKADVAREAVGSQRRRREEGSNERVLSRHETYSMMI
jgi:hypothetical protein